MAVWGIICTVNLFSLEPYKIKAPKHSFYANISGLEFTSIGIGGLKKSTETAVGQSVDKTINY